MPYRLFIVRYNTRHVLEYDVLADVVFMQVHSHRPAHAARTAVCTASFGHKLLGTTERNSVQGSPGLDTSSTFSYRGTIFPPRSMLSRGYPDENVTYATFWA